MKKIIILVITILLIVLAYFMIFKSIKIGPIHVESVSQIKNMSFELNNKFTEASKLASQEYPNQVNELQNSTAALTDSKKKFEAKAAYSNLGEEAFATYLKQYKIETLMVTLGRYSNKVGLSDLKMDLKTAQNEEQKDLYNLGITLVGTYESVYNFLYEIENDDELKFEAVGLTVEPNTTKITTSTSGPKGGGSSNTEYPYDEKQTITASDAYSTATAKKTEANSNQENEGEANNTETKTTTTTTTTNNSGPKEKTDVVYDTNSVKAQFTIENVSISFT